MALNANEVLSGGVVRDQDGRRSAVLAGGSGLQPGERYTGGRVIDADGRDVISPLVGSLPVRNPADAGLTAWTGDPDAATGGNVITAGTLFLTKAKIVTPGATLTKFAFNALVAASAELANFWVGVYSTGDVLLGKADATARGKIQGDSVLTLTAEAGQSLAVSTSFVWLAFVVGTQGTTPLQLSRFAGGVASQSNFGLTAAPFRALSMGTGLTALPATTTTATATSTSASVAWCLGVA